MGVLAEHRALSEEGGGWAYLSCRPGVCPGRKALLHLCCLSRKACCNTLRLALHFSSSASMSSTEWRFITGTSPSGNSFLQCFSNSACSHIVQKE
ncbi:hypothetical protein PO909_025460 [Leuciscus waleckii]